MKSKKKSKKVKEVQEVLERVWYTFTRRLPPLPHPYVKSFKEYILHHGVPKQWEIYDAIAPGAAAVQIAEYALTGKAPASKCEVPVFGFGCDGTTYVDGVMLFNAPKKAHGVFIASKYWRKACLPVRPGPAAEALIRVGEKAIGHQVSVLKGIRDIGRSPITASTKLTKWVEKATNDTIARDAVEPASVMSYYSETPLGPIAAVIYVISKLSGYTLISNVYIRDLAANVVFLLRHVDHDARLCAMAVEFCKSNIYVWSPVRRYRIPASTYGAVEAVAKAQRETEKICNSNWV